MFGFLLAYANLPFLFLVSRLIAVA